MRLRQSKEEQRIKENLQDYEQEYERFKWSDVERELNLPTDGMFNIVEAAIDQKAVGINKNKTAFAFYNGSSEKKLSYFKLKQLTNRFANVLNTLGIKKGERVALFLPPIPEFYIAFLGTIKTGAIVVPLSTSFMPDAMTEILNDSEARVIITTDSLQNRVKEELLPNLKNLLLVQTNNTLNEEVTNEMKLNFHELINQASDLFDAVLLSRDDPMMLLYTSGSTGRPKGVIHVHGGISHYYQTGKWVLDFHKNDIFWCTCEPSWISGISYGIWAPLLNGVTSVVYSGGLIAEKWYEVLAKYRVNVWYTTPTALKILMNFGLTYPAQHYNLDELRHILTVGEPLNPVLIRWSDKVFGLKVHDTWWMTETGGQMICNFRCMPIKPGSMGRPIPGIYASVIDETGNELPPLEVGQLAIKLGWPAMMSGIWKDEGKYREYFRLNSWYLTGDLVYRDSDGYFWFQGRVDDVIKTAGERIGPFEIENKLIEHSAVLEAGVIGKPDPLWGEIIKAFVVLKPEFRWSVELNVELQEFIKNRLGTHLVPSEIEPCKALPRTRSGKIMRRVLKAQELGLSAGDLSTMGE